MILDLIRRGTVTVLDSADDGVRLRVTVDCTPEEAAVLVDAVPHRTLRVEDDVIVMSR